MASDQTVQSEPSRTAVSRFFFVGMALYMTVIVVVGFWPSYFVPVLSGKDLVGLGVVDESGVLHVHAAVYFGWMILLVTQAMLVSRNRTRIHRRVGWYGMVFGIVVAFVGLVMTFVEMQNEVVGGIESWPALMAHMWPSLETLTQFVVLLALGYGYRSAPEAHKRYVLFATLALLFAATDRMFYLLGPWCAEIMFVLTVGPIFAYDLYSRAWPHAATVVGTLILLPHFLLRAAVGY